MDIWLDGQYFILDGKQLEYKAIQIAKNLIAKRQMLLEMFAQATEVPLEKIKNLALIKTE
jgi:hypothetical protein